MASSAVPYKMYAGPGPDLTLDPDIRDKVLLPLTLVVVLSGIARFVIAKYFDAPPKPQPPLAVREQRAITRGQLLRAHSSYLPPAAFVALRAHLAENYINGSFLKEPPAPEGTTAAPKPNPLEDPAATEAMLDGLKDMMSKQAAGFIPQMATMYLVNRFFPPALLARIPFPLPVRFKELLQRGVPPAILTGLDASWCSGTSWYFLCMFGLSPVYQLLLGDGMSANNMAAMNPMMAATASGPGGGPAGGPAPPPQMPGAPGPDYSKMFRAERENLDIVEYSWVAEGVEDRLLKRFADKL
ncbi:hypothetical protein JCM8115_001871 [Rhodotorula mucilaginosa]|uniref:ER membrane protein complex subunit 3 n=1 Tax=Rhodotorula mucilaginosa TaxID=5537 RepID=A0A9P6VZ91_RHOMI|nr:ER membrane complex subunit 3 [Rhodotorula mucilaginosa]TKA50843.1 hypothetical protein B0A53_05919 [Rhodotorula sp. CCFEE 5036]